MTGTDKATVERVLSEVDRLATELLAAVQRAVGIASVNPKYPGQSYDDLVGRESEVARLVAQVYEQAGAEVDIFAIEEGRDNAVGVMRGAGGGRSLVYNGHIDVVPPGDPASWTNDPYSGVSEGGRILGRGATDMKAGVLAQAYAAVALRRAGVRLAGDLTLAAVVGEEVGDHECGTTATIKRGYVGDVAVVSEPSGPPYPLAIVPVTPGSLWFSVTVAGKAAHCRLPRRDATSHDLRCRARRQRHRQGLPDLSGAQCTRARVGRDEAPPALPERQVRDAARLHPRLAAWHRGPVLPRRVGAHRVRRDVPPRRRRRLDEGGHRAADRARIRADPWLREHRPVVEWKLEWEPYVLDPEHEILPALARSHERAAAGTRLEGPAKQQGFGGVCDSTWYEAAGIPSVIYGPGDLRLAHAGDEYVEIDEVVTACKAFALLAMDWCGTA